MKKLLKYLSIALVGGWIATSCYKDVDKDGGYQKPAVQSYTPVTNENVTANPGATVTLTGVNLANAETILVGGVEAMITEKSFKNLTFIIPLSPEFEQAKVTKTQIVVKSAQDGDGYTWKKDYFIYLDPTDAIVTSFTPTTAIAAIGDEITVKGHNLDLVSAFKFGSVTVAASEFASQTLTEIKFAVPDAAFAPGDATVVFSYVWGDEQETVITESFVIKTPAPDNFIPPVIPTAIGESISFTGTNTDLIDRVEFVNPSSPSVIQSAVIQSVDPLTIVVPNADFAAFNPTDHQITVNIIGYAKNSTQAITLATAVVLNVAAPAVVEPVATAVTYTEGGAGTAADPYRLYLLKEVQLTGTNFMGIDKIEIDGLEAEITAQTATSVTFIVPEAFTFNTATEKQITATYGGSLTTTLQPADVVFKVYPYYFWKNKTLGAQAATNVTYNFFAFDTGEVFSGDRYCGRAPYDELGPWDPHGYTNKTTQTSFTDPAPPTTTTMTAANAINQNVVSKEEYESVKPYFLVNVTSGVVSLISPSNSLTQIRSQRIGTGDAISTIFSDAWTGTPIIMFRNLVGTENGDNDAITAGTIESLAAQTRRASAGAPGYDEGNANNKFAINSVVMVQYMSYDKTTSGTPTIDLVLKTGYLIIKTVKDPTLQTSTVTFDCLWPYNNRQ